MARAIQVAGAIIHLVAFAAWATFIAGWVLDLGYFSDLKSKIESGTAGAAAQALGEDALKSMVDPLSDAFVVYLFIVLGLIAIVFKLFHACCNKFKYLGLVTIILVGASNAVGGFVAGPKGKSYINCLASGSNNMSSQTTCVEGENETPILIMFIGSGLYVLCMTLAIGVMYVDAMQKAFPTNKVQPEKAAEVWA